MVCGALLLSACTSQPQIKPEWMSKVQDRHPLVDVVNVIENVNASGDLELAIDFENQSVQNTKIHYSVIWFKNNGMPIKTLLGKKKRVSLQTKESLSEYVVSPGSKATEYQIILEK